MKKDTESGRATVVIFRHLRPASAASNNGIIPQQVKTSRKGTAEEARTVAVLQALPTR